MSPSGDSPGAHGSGKGSNNSTKEDAYDGSSAGDISSSCTSMPSGMTQKQREEIAAKENRAVFWLRMLVLVVLLASALAVSFVVHRHLSNAEQLEFENQYHSDAQKVLDAVGKSLDDTFGATDAFATKLVSYAEYSGSKWPLVTLPKFGLHASKLLRLSKAFFLGISIEVQPEQRSEWEQYALENTGWIQESIDILKTDENYKGAIVDPPEGWQIQPSIYIYQIKSIIKKRRIRLGFIKKKKKEKKMASLVFF